MQVPAGISFPVWDALTSLDPRAEEVSSVSTSSPDGEIISGLRLSRGAEFFDGPALIIASFAANALGSDARWHIRDTLMATVAPLAQVTGRTLLEVMNELQGLLDGGTPWHLTIGGKAVEAVRIPVDSNAWIIGSLARAYPVAVAGSYCDVPELRAADWSVWRSPIELVVATQ